MRAEAWPANVRELRNALERAIILADGNVLRSEHLWLESEREPDAAGAAHALAVAAGAGASGDGSLADLERQTIASTLVGVGGNRRAAAAKLGIGLRTLYEKLKRYDLR